MKHALLVKQAAPLEPHERLEMHDWIEWLPGTYTRVVPDSLYVGTQVSELRAMTSAEGRSSPARAYRDS